MSTEVNIIVNRKSGMLLNSPWKTTASGFEYQKNKSESNTANSLELNDYGRGQLLDGSFLILGKFKNIQGLADNHQDNWEPIYSE